MVRFKGKVFGVMNSLSNSWSSLILTNKSWAVNSKGGTICLIKDSKDLQTNGTLHRIKKLYTMSKPEPKNGEET